MKVLRSYLNAKWRKWISALWIHFMANEIEEKLGRSPRVTRDSCIACGVSLMTYCTMQFNDLLFMAHTVSCILSKGILFVSHYFWIRNLNLFQPPLLSFVRRLNTKMTSNWNSSLFLISTIYLECFNVVSIPSSSVILELFRYVWSLIIIFSWVFDMFFILLTLSATNSHN